MLRLTIVLLFLSSLAHTNAGGKKCEPGEEWSDCAPCDRRCDNLNPICTLECRVGCYCKKGYVRDKCDNCISEDCC